MATLSALIFGTVDGAMAAVAEVRILATARSLVPLDAATVAWRPDELRPDLRRATELQPRAPMGAGFWNLLFNHLFLLPMAAAEVGIPAQSLTGSLARLGIQDDFLRTGQRRLTRGTSALFLLTNDANVDPVIGLLASLPFTVTSTNLSTRQLEALRAAFGTGPLDVSHEDRPALRAAEINVVPQGRS
jgi:uncharacterized membrane protein